MKALLLALFSVLTAPVYAAELMFEDVTPYNNFTVRQLNPDGSKTNAFLAGNSHFFATEGWKEGELRKFLIAFSVPKSDDFKIGDAQKITLAIDVVATQDIIENGVRIPVHYFTCKASCGFKNLEKFKRNNVESIFKSYFLAAQMAEYYRMTYPDQKTAQGKRAVRIWRDAAYSLCLMGENWFSFPKELVDGSAFAFGEDSKAHVATVRYANRILEGKCKR